jgi:hypothetical protein
MQHFSSKQLQQFSIKIHPDAGYGFYVKLTPMSIALYPYERFGFPCCTYFIFSVNAYSGSQSDGIQARGRGNPAPTGFAI